MCTSFAPALRNSWTTRPIVFPRTMESSISTTRFPRILSSTAESLIFTLSSLAPCPGEMKVLPMYLFLIRPIPYGILDS